MSDNTPGSDLSPAAVCDRAPRSVVTAALIIDELRRWGVRDVVICPGSRSAPLTFAAAIAEQRGEIRVHVRADERTAAFFALGIARTSGRVVPVMMTSGSAVVHCGPAMVEAAYSHIPLAVISANRPRSYVGTGANQTIDQRRCLPDAVVWEGVDTATAHHDGWATAHREVRAGIDRACAAAVSTPGPVHIDVPSDTPLVVSDMSQLETLADAVCQLAEPTAASHPWTAIGDSIHRPQPGCDWPLRRRPRSRWGSATINSDRVLHIAGDPAGGSVVIPDALAGVPTIAEPMAPYPDVPVHPLAIDALQPEHIVVTGRPTLHRSISQALATRNIPITVVTDAATYPDVSHTVAQVVSEITVAPQSPQWLAECEDADQQAIGAVRELVTTAADITPDTAIETDNSNTDESANGVDGLLAAAAVVDSLVVGDTVVLGASNSVRDASLLGLPMDGVTVHSNRGVAGIDGFISTACGIAMATQWQQSELVGAGPRTVAICGDLTFLHDVTGLSIAPGERRPNNLLLVVLNDSGGGIFETLETGDPGLRSLFERFVATDQHADLGALCEGYGVTYACATTLADLQRLLADHAEGIAIGHEGHRGDGIVVVEVRTDRSRRRHQNSELKQRIASTGRVDSPKDME